VNTSIVIDLFSEDELSLNPCEKKEVRSGVLLKTFIPITHSIYFEGITNNFGIKSISKCVVPIFEKELNISFQFFPKKC
jgi:hypothetical protein